MASVAKILKIKKLIGELGGVSKVVSDIRKSGWAINNIRKIGGPLGPLVKEFLGVKEIEDNCFNDA